VSEHLLYNEEDTSLRNLMEKGLTLGPQQGTAAILAKARNKRRRIRAFLSGIAAAVLICLYATSPLVLPALARAISAVPGIGPNFEQALKIHSLDLAYEAGLLATLDKSVERDGVTLTVHAAYRDARTFNILLSIKGDKEFIKYLARSIGPDVRLSSGRWKLSGYYSSRLYDEEDDVLYVSLSSFEPLPWYVRTLSVSVRWLVNQADIEKYTTHIAWDLVEASDPLTVSFPVQRASEKHTHVVPINQTIYAGETTVNIESVVFTPIRTILNYTYTGRYPSLDMVDENGEIIRGFVGGDDPKGSKFICEATDSQEITIRFRGYHANYDVEVPLQEGYEHPETPKFRIDSFSPVHKLLPWISSTGEDTYADTKVAISWKDDKWGVSASSGHVENHENAATIYLVGKYINDKSTINLTFTRLEGELQEIFVVR